MQEKDWDFKIFIPRNCLVYKAIGLLPKDKSTLFCEVSLVADSINILGQSNNVQFKVPVFQFSDDLPV